MKKLLALVFVVLMMVVALSACTQPAQTPAATEAPAAVEATEAPVVETEAPVVETEAPAAEETPAEEVPAA